MKRGLELDETYEGPPLDAVEFRLHDGNLDQRAALLVDLKRRFGTVSAHLPSYMPVVDARVETAFARGLPIDHAHRPLHGIGGWVKRLIARHPDVILLVETGHPQFSVSDKLDALERWLE